jgi:hypothetical protein
MSERQVVGERRAMRSEGLRARLLAVARPAVRVTFVIQLLLGVGLWTGRLDSLRLVHILVGVLFVLGLWTVAVLAAAAGVNRVQVSVALLWGVVLPVFGLTQEHVLEGGLHWTVQVVHVVLAVAAIAQAEALAGSVRRRSPLGS